MSFPGGSAGKEFAYNAGDLGSIPGLGRFPGEGNSYPLQYYGLENSMDCIAHGVAKSQTRLSNFHLGFPHSSVGKESASNARDLDSIPGLGRSAGEGYRLPSPCSSSGKESTCSVRDLGSVPGLGRSPGERKGYPFQYSGLENSMDFVIHMVTKSQT